MRRSSIAVVTLAAWSLACGGGAIEEELTEEIVGGATGGDVELSGGGGLSATGADGSTATIGSGATLPSDWPSDVPTPSGTLTAVFQTPSAAPGKSDFTASWETSDAPSAVMDLYKGKLSDWTKTMEMGDTSGSSLFLTSPDGKRTLMIIATPGTPGSASLTIAHTP